LRNIVPEDYVFGIADQFFAVDVPVERRKLPEIDRLLSFARQLEREISEYGTPSSMSNFNGFFQRLVRKAAAVYDEELSDFPTLKSEMRLARVVFSSKIGGKIDGFIQRSIDGRWVQFSDGVPLFCQTLIADVESSSEKEHSIAILLFYRIVVDRAHELVPRFHATDWMFSKLAKVLSAPAELLEPGVTGMTSQAYFRSQPSFSAPAQAIAILDFLVNPLDILVQFRHMISRVHANVLEEKLGRKPTDVDLRMVIEFDELFAFLFGALLASDVVDTEAMCATVKLLTPRRDLSSVLEYALVCFEAVILEIGRLSSQVAHE
jgi:hypothetical protein